MECGRVLFRARHDSDTIASLSPGDILLETNQTGYRRLDAGGQNSNRTAHGQPAARQLARIAPKAVGAMANDPLDKKPGRPVRPRCADRQGLQQGKQRQTVVPGGMARSFDHIVALERRQGNNMKIVDRSEAHTSELQSLMRTTYAVFCC